MCKEGTIVIIEGFRLSLRDEANLDLQLHVGWNRLKPGVGTISRNRLHVGSKGVDVLLMQWAPGQRKSRKPQGLRESRLLHI